MAKKIKLIGLSLKNFKNHQDLQVSFGEVTKITGDNSKGKSSITEAITWLLYGIDTLGSKLDPTPITYESDETTASLLLSIDGKNILLGRSLKKGKAKYFLNEVPIPATEFNEHVASLFEKELFLSLYNPSYFFTLKWDKQRSMLLQYVQAPANKEVLNRMSDLQSDRLGELLKKHSLKDIEKIHKENKNTKDKTHIAAQSRTKTLRSELDEIQAVSIPLDSIKVELAQIDKQVKERESQMDQVWEKNQAFNKIQSQIQNVTHQIELSKEMWPSLKNEEIEEHCKTCKQSLDEKAIEEVRADHESRKASYKENHNRLLNERKELQSKLAEMEFIDLSEAREEILEIDKKGAPLREALRITNQYERLKGLVAQAEQEEQDILTSLNDSIFVLDSIKAFRAKESEIQVEKVQALFNKLSIKLFEELKNGEIKPTFEVELDGKEYKRLSLSEGIRAGLELREVLIKQSEVVVPVCIDNAESITKFTQPTGQLIMAQVVAGKELDVESK